MVSAKLELNRVVQRPEPQLIIAISFPRSGVTHKPSAWCSSFCAELAKASLSASVLPLWVRQPGAAGCRLEGGELEFAEHAHNEDMGGIESLVDLDAGFADDEEYDEVHSSPVLSAGQHKALAAVPKQDHWMCRMTRIWQMVTGLLQMLAW